MHKDCGDGLDEALCSRNRCLAGQWQCRNKVCVMDSWKCNGVNDCGDSSDEEACGESPAPPTSPALAFRVKGKAVLCGPLSANCVSFL